MTLYLQQPVFPYFLLQDMMDWTGRLADTCHSEQAFQIFYIRRLPFYSLSQSFLTLHVVRTQLFQKRMETGSVIRMFQMTQFMQDDIVAQWFRKPEQIQIQIDIVL